MFPFPLHVEVDPKVEVVILRVENGYVVKQHVTEKKKPQSLMMNEESYTQAPEMKDVPVHKEVTFVFSSFEGVLDHITAYFGEGQ